MTPKVDPAEREAFGHWASIAGYGSALSEPGLLEAFHGGVLWERTLQGKGRVRSEDVRAQPRVDTHYLEGLAAIEEEDEEPLRKPAGVEEQCLLRVGHDAKDHAFKLEGGVLGRVPSGAARCPVTWWEVERARRRAQRAVEMDRALQSDTLQVVQRLADGLKRKYQDARNAADGSVGNDRVEALYVARAMAYADAVADLIEPYGGEWTRLTGALSHRLAGLSRGQIS